MVRSIAPLIAPAIGSAIIHFFPWEAVFIFLTIYSLVIAFFVYKDLPESFTKTKQKVLESFKLVLTHKTAMKAMITLGFTFGGYFVIIAKSSFIYIEYFKINTDYFPFFFGINIVVLMGIIKVNIALLKKYDPLTIVKTALLMQVFSGILFILNYENISIVSTVLIIALYMSMMGFIFGNCMALALEHFQKNAGVASSVSGVLQFGLGSIISSLALSFHSENFSVIAYSITIISAISFLVIRTYKHS